MDRDPEQCRDCGHSVGRIYAEFTGRKAQERESLQCQQIFSIDKHREPRGMPFATTFCDLKNRKIFYVVPERNGSELATFLNRLQGRENVKRPASTLHNWRKSLATIWRFTKNNDITEGFHRKMKLIQRRAYSFKNFHNYRLRVLALCG